MKHVCIAFFLLGIVTLCAQQPAYQWTKQLGGPGSSFNIPYVTVDAGDNVVCLGNFNGILDFDPGPGTYTLSAPALYPQLSVSKYNAAGSLLWAKMVGGTDGCWGWGSATDAANNIYITGYFSGAIDFDPGAGNFTLNAPGANNWDIFVLKLDANGNFVWAKRFGDASSQAGKAIAADAAGNICITGEFLGTVDFDPGTGIFNMTAPSSNAFILKLDSQGNFIWARQSVALGPVTLSNTHSATAIHIGMGGDIYTTGWFHGTMDIDPGSGTYTMSTSSSMPAVYLLKLDASGNFVWAMQLGDGTTLTTCDCLAEDGSGNICFSGSFRNTIDFDRGPGTYNMTGSVGGNVFILKMTAQGNFIWAKQFARTGNAGGSSSSSMDIDACDGIYTTGSFGETVDFDPGPGTFTLSSNYYAGAFLSKIDASGNFEWALALNPVMPQQSGGISGTTLKLNSSGSLYTLGSFSGVVDFDPGPAVYTLDAGNTTEGDFFLSNLNSCSSLCELEASNTSSIICAGESTTLIATGAGAYSWQPGAGNSGTFVTTPTVTTTYTVSSSTEDGCFATTLLTQSVSACVGIASINAPENFKVYPNPTSGILHLEGESYNDTEIIVLDGTDRVVFKDKVTQGQLDVSHLPAGFYLLICQEKRIVQKTLKLIKE